MDCTFLSLVFKLLYRKGVISFDEYDYITQMIFPGADVKLVNERLKEIIERDFEWK